jgi:hypothetical protein
VKKKVGLWRHWGRSAAVIGSFQARSRSECAGSGDQVACGMVHRYGACRHLHVRLGVRGWVAEVEGVDVYSCPVYYQFEARGLCLFVHVRLECLRCEL